VSELSPLAWRLRRCLLSLERDHIQLAEVWTCLLGAAPELLEASDRRLRLRHALDELARSGWLALPDGRNAYDRRDPPLPRSIEVLAAGERARRLGTMRTEDWHPRLRWATDIDTDPVMMHDLVRINRWVAEQSATAVIVPPRERSLQLFGAGGEDRLHELAQSDLFADDRLTWELLCCAPVPPPFVWSPVGPGGTVLVVSGHETFASVRRVLVEAPSTHVGIVVHGAGPYFGESVSFAATLDRPVERILYYGDIAVEDVAAGGAAGRRAMRAGLPPVRAAEVLFELLLATGTPAPARPVDVARAHRHTGWLPAPLRDRVLRLLVSGRRFAQEWVGYEVLLRERIWERLGLP
jgi:hypothetical protein